MAEVRDRRYTIPRHSGTLKIGTTILPGEAWNSGRCRDVAGNYGVCNNPLTIQKWSCTSQPINGKYGVYQYENWPVTCSRHAHDLAVPLGWAPSYNKSVAEALADSHPGEPAVSIPNFLFELKDMPGMLKHAASKLGKKHPKAPPKSAADDYLAYTFGWAPLVSDLMSIYDVAGWCESRARMLRNIRSRGFTSRKKTRGSDSHKWSDTFAYNTIGQSVQGRGDCSVECEAWVSSRWIHTGNLPLASFINNERGQLVAASLGLEIGFQQLWDAMPWSWLVDYFTDLSSVIGVHRNRAGFQFAGGAQMETRTITRTVHPVRPPWPCSPVTQKLVEKRRSPANASLLDVGLNFLSPRQLVTLGALMVSRI